MKAYLSGPMAGIEDFNKPEFHRCAQNLRDAGFDVVSPAEIQIPGSASWEECLKADLKEMLDCDIVINMKGWGHSKGARLEHQVAIAVGIPFCEIDVALTSGPEKVESLIKGHHLAQVIPS